MGVRLCVAVSMLGCGCEYSDPEMWVLFRALVKEAVTFMYAYCAVGVC